MFGVEEVLLYSPSMSLRRFPCRGVLLWVACGLAGCVERKAYPSLFSSGDGFVNALSSIFLVVNEFGLLVRSGFEHGERVIVTRTWEHSMSVRELDELTILANKGEAAAQDNLGSCYYMGRGMAADSAQAAFWYQRSADQGFAKGQHNLAMCYEFGEGVRRDQTEAYAFVSLAAATIAEDRPKIIHMELGMTPVEILKGKARAATLRSVIAAKAAEAKRQSVVP